MNRDKIIVLVSAIVLVIGMVIIAKKNLGKTEDENTTKSYGNAGSYEVDPTSDEPFHFWEGLEVSEEATTTVSLEEIPSSHELKLDLINQYPELPSGCESVALTMVLNYYGFNLDKTTIADNYLIYSDDNYVLGFKGNPRNQAGGGAYAPSMANTANRFLLEQGSDLKAVNISGTELKDLYAFIAGGTPVIVWTTIDNADAKQVGDITSYGKTEYRWVTNEHCVVLAGYNEDKNEVTIYDSISGIVTYDKDSFENTYNQMWRMAIILENNAS